jgi:hypothetical protein
MIQPPIQPSIKIKSGEISRIVDEAEQALIKHGSQIYHRGGELVRPCRVGQLSKKDEAGAITRNDEAIVLIPVNGTWIIEQMSRSAEWYKVSKAPGGKRVKRILDPKPIYALTLLARNGEWKFPALRGCIVTPTMTLDGRLIQKSGYDEDSKLLLNIGVDEFPIISERPTKDEAIAALKILANPFRLFPFIGSGSRSVVLSGMLTSIIRTSLRTSPLHAMDSPSPGNGKSMLAETIGIFSTGTLPPAMSQGKSPEEDEKRLSTVLHYGDPVIHLDNCERPITGDFLCSILTQEIVQARILGESERRVLPSTALVIASGNNITLAGDVTRRSIIARIDSKTERPDEREFDFDPRDETRRDRVRMVHCALTVLKAYHEAGRPEKLRPMGSFEDWEIVRGALVWLGETDPAETRTAIYNADPVREEISEIMDLWGKAYRERKVYVTDIEKPSPKTENLNGINDLKEKLIEACCRSGTWSGRSVGRWLMRNKERIINHRYFTVTEDEKHGHLWQLKPAQGKIF